MFMIPESGQSQIGLRLCRRTRKDVVAALVFSSLSEMLVDISFPFTSYLDFKESHPAILVNREIILSIIVDLLQGHGASS